MPYESEEDDFFEPFDMEMNSERPLFPSLGMYQEMTMSPQKRKFFGNILIVDACPSLVFFFLVGCLVAIFVSYLLSRNF